MPYIAEERRGDLELKTSQVIMQLDKQGWDVGDVTFVVYYIVKKWFVAKRRFDTIAKIRGMLASVLSEFDRRHAFEYENDKITQNGDVS